MLNKEKFKNLFNFHAGRDRLVKLYNLHGDRVLGDIPIHPSNNIDPPEIMHAAKKAGLGALLVTEEEGFERGWMGGTVYVYDRKRLQRLLNENKDMLKAADWPQDADKFVRHLSWVAAPVNSEINDFIAKCHEVNGQDPQRKPYRVEDPELVAQLMAQAQFDKMRYKALQENDPAAAKWMQGQTNTGNTAAMTYMGLLYERGAGVKQDYAEAAFWSGLAVKNTIQGYRRFLDAEPEKARTRLGPNVQPGDSDDVFWEATRTTANLPDAVKIRDEALAHLSADQADAVQQRIAAWRPAPPAPAPLRRVWG